MHTHQTPVRTFCLALAAAICLLNATFMMIRKAPAQQEITTAQQQSDDRDVSNVLSILPSFGPASMIGMHGLTAIMPAR